jgi:hypothetical protein
MKVVRILSIVALSAVMFTSCFKEETDLSGYVTNDQYSALQQQLDDLQNKLNSQTDSINSLQNQINNQGGGTVTQFAEYQFDITYPFINEQYEQTVDYTGLRNVIKSSDAVLVYGWLNGGWFQMPYCAGNDAFYCIQKNDGTLTFTHARAIYVTFSYQSFTASIRVIIIPKEVLETMNASGVNQNDYDHVRSYLAAID